MQVRCPGCGRFAKNVPGARVTHMECLKRYLKRVEQVVDAAVAKWQVRLDK